MPSGWQRTFHNRMREFERDHKMAKNAISVSVKTRVTSGCFHREHSPHAYHLIDKYLTTIDEETIFAFEEHESGPEILIYVAAATAGISLAKSIIDLIVSILKARSEGIKKGDKPQAPLELIVRRSQKDGEFKEETILRINHQDTIDPSLIDKQLKQAISDIIKEKNKKRG